ncbi:MAG: guanylate kinase [Chloroflexi bacterium]|nr:guanylate kinase [Chloroflexota bacterium]
MTENDGPGSIDEYNPLVVVISGPSGVGKDVIIEGMAGRGLNYHFTVTATTRDPRPGEREGINHHFLDIEEFQRRIETDELLEWARVFGNYYGVPKQQVRDAIAAGDHVIIRVDVQGALRIKEIAPEALMIFVHPPDMAVLQRRIERRGLNSQSEIETRLAAAEDEIATSPIFDYQVVNHEGQLEAAVNEVTDIVHRESRRVPPRKVKI